MTSAIEPSSPDAVARGEVLRAKDVAVTLPDGRHILEPTSLAVTPGTFVALLGPSGSGKTTLLRAMAGVVDPTDGEVTLGGDPVAERVEDLGYVPQRETVHDRLTVREALRYAALLRSDAGTDVEAVLEDVLVELDLVEQAQTPIRNLSGGERRRTACGLELVGRPGVLLLDEPTSGLDPVLERRLMLMFRRLADQGRAVVVVTHATASLDLCDAVVVLEPGGRVALTGTPADAHRHLREIAREADLRHEARAAAAGPGAGHHAATPHHGTGRPSRPLRTELRLLTERYAKTLLRDRRTLGVLLAQAPIIGLLIAILFEPGVLDHPDDEVGNSAMLVFLVMTGAIWLGVTSACREVVKERGILEREFDVGLRLDAYVIAKAVVLFAFSAVQVVLMLLVVLVLQPPDEGAGAVLALLGLAVLVSWVSVAMGLAVSTVARTVDQAAGVVPLLLIPQLLFSGALVPLERMPPGVAGLAELTYGRWAYAGMGSSIDLDERLAADSDSAAALGFGRDFFALSPGTSAAVLAGIGLLLLLLATTLLTRRAPVD